MQDSCLFKLAAKRNLITEVDKEEMTLTAHQARSLLMVRITSKTELPDTVVPYLVFYLGREELEDKPGHDLLSDRDEPLDGSSVTIQLTF